MVKAIVERRGHGTEELGELLADALGKPEPFDHGAISRFLNNKTVTHEMVDAFVRLYGVPPIWYEARSLEEAIELAAEHRDEVTSEQDRRLATVDQVAETERRATIDQRDRVASVNEGTRRHRRPGRTARGGS